MNQPSIGHSMATTPKRRRTVLQTSGHGHGPITRLVSPGDLGQQIKPFVFLDHVRITSGSSGIAMHPHSGIATLTWLIRGSIEYEDTTGKRGILPSGGVEWMQAGGGVWHTGGAVGQETVEGFQLWVALRPEWELSAAESLYLPPETIPEIGPAKLLMGCYGGAVGPIPPVAPLNYLGVALKDGESWRYEPPSGHNIAWIAVNRGELLTPDLIIEGKLAIFEEGEQAIDFTAVGATEFVVGSAPKHPYPLVLGRYSVHTSPQALYTGESNIRRLGQKLAHRRITML